MILIRLFSFVLCVTSLTIHAAQEEGFFGGKAPQRLRELMRCEGLSWGAIAGGGIMAGGGVETYVAY